MKKFIAFFIFNWKHFFTRRNTIMTLCFAFIALMLVQYGVSHYKDILTANREAARFEKEETVTIKNIDIYGALGVKLKTTPPPIYIFFFNSGLFNHVTSRIDCGHSLEVYRFMQGKEGINESIRTYGDFSGWLHLMGALIMLFYGLETFKRLNFFKTLCSLSSTARTFFYTLLARYMVLWLLLVAITGVNVLGILLRGIGLTSKDFTMLALYLLVASLVFFFYFLAGIIAGLLSKKHSGAMAVIIIWISLIYLYPLAIKKASGIAAEKMPSNTLINSQKWKLLDNYEKRAKKEYGKKYPQNRTDDPKLKKLILSYLQQEHLQIKEIEDGLRLQMQDNNRLVQWLSIISPASIYNVFTSEISGTGYGNMIDFYRHSQNLKDNFFIYFMKRKFWNNDYKTPFIKDHENILMSESHLPETFLLGLLILTGYWVTFLWLGFALFKKRLFHIDSQYLDKSQELDFHFTSGQFQVAQSMNKSTANLFYSYLCNALPLKLQKEMSISLSVDKQLINRSSDLLPHDFVYICPPHDLPLDVTAPDLLLFLQRITDSKWENLVEPPVPGLNHLDHHRPIKDLCNSKRASILLSIPLLKHSPIYFFHDTVTKLPNSATACFKDLALFLTKHDASVLYLTRNSSIHSTPSLAGNLLVYPYWVQEVDSMESFENGLKN